MTRLIGIVISIGLADSLNPTTIGPALYLASGEHARHHVTRFTVGVFLAYLAGGAIILLGPGQLLLSLLPHPDAEDRQVIEVVVGAVMMGSAALLWRHRGRLGAKEFPVMQRGGHSSTLLGATIMAVELPTAFPYFGAIAAIVGSGAGLTRQLLLLLLFNVCFVLPLIGIAATLWLVPGHAVQLLGRGRDLLQRHWPGLLAGAIGIVGVVVMLLGATGLGSRGRGGFSHFLRHVHNFLPKP